MIILKLKKASNNEETTLWVAKDSVKVDGKKKVLCFNAYMGKSGTGEDLYAPYVLSIDRSPQKKGNLHASIEAAILLWRTTKGAIKGSEAGLLLGPDAMKARALSGAAKGFGFGLLFIAAGEIARHIYHEYNNTPLYYISVSGPDFVGPIYL